MRYTHDVPDHPIIRNMERTGYPDGKEPEYPRCPICEEETDTLYKDKYGEVFGCSECINKINAFEYQECAK